MTLPQHDHDSDDDSFVARTAGIARRSALAAAWTAPVVAAAVAAPGASASPVPVGTGTFVGVAVHREDVRGFNTKVYVNGERTPAGTVVLEVEAEIVITTEHDVDSWGSGIVAVGPRTGRLVLPVGSYPANFSYPLDGRAVWVSLPDRPRVTLLSASPRGAFSATATVLAPVYPGPDPAATRGYGVPSSTIVVTV
ncbi:hypothetical protein [Rathayibacter sp. VKM Ac-2760]|uniref:hypothetical protein n=1 Tax=Rathayibacter sp. VKM Ac-2760 TaxID=2609253 RepID=UPI001317E89C|nr:hypothetical protein [Rathayibacter sp. VKM Ac-2760]QHC58469.1 hypothetical protein GSU72_07870 [Rathayibacter sp. VKM Ac-2760]